MALQIKVLGQLNPAGNTNTTLYSVPSDTSAVISTLNVCNYSTSSATFSIAIRPSGEALASKHYFSFNTSLAGNESLGITAGITLAATDVVTVSANTSNVSFSVFGSENK
jgi:hypothetical protein